MNAGVPAGFEPLGQWGQVGEKRVSVALCRDAENRVLLQWRDDWPHIISPGRWGFFGGHIEADETPEAAMLREFEEETGIRLAKSEIKPAYAILTGPPRWTLLHVFRVLPVINAPDIRLLEGAGFGFCSAKQTRSIDLLPFFVPVLQAYWGHDVFATEQGR